MFKTPVSTIKDVAELTDAPPTLIARILGDMRGPHEFEKLHHQVQVHTGRLEDVERKLSNLSNRYEPIRIYQPLDIESRRAETVIMVDEWINRPRQQSVGVTLSAWEDGDDYRLRGTNARKRGGLRPSDLFFILLFVAIFIFLVLVMRGDIGHPALTPS